MNTAIKTSLNSTASLLAAVLFGLMGAASGGRALATEQQPLTKIVRYGDLNLDSDQGAQALYARLRGAANQVCSPLKSIEMSRQHAWQQCFDNAIGTAVAEVGKTTLSALHSQAVSGRKS
jgi:UrcA family protein